MGNRYALVTGASSGIGFEIAKCLASRNYNLLLTARKEENLRKAALFIEKDYGVKVGIIASDLQDKSSPNSIYDFCKLKKYNIEILINNAGYAIPTSFDQTSMEEEEKFIRVLGIAVIALSKLFIKDMLAQGKGRIMIVSSVAAFAPPSTIQVLYGPIKTFMNRFSESLNLNYNHKGITTTSLCPGYTITNFHSASGVQQEMDRVPFFMKKEAKRVAEEGVEALLKGKPVCVPSKTFKIIVFLLKLIPTSLFFIMSSHLSPGRYDKK